MKHLKIEYTTESGSKITLFDDEIAEVIWSDSASGVRVEGKTTTGGGMNLLEMLTGASKNRTEAVAEEKKAALAEEKATKTRSKAKVVEVVEASDDGIEVIQAAQA